MSRQLLVPAIGGIILANLLVFGVVGMNYFKPTPRPTRVNQRATFTPNPELAKRRVTVTPTHTSTPTRIPTTFLLRDPRGPIGGPED